MIDETVREIEEMHTQGSSVVAVKAAEALRDLTEREYPTVGEFLRSIERNSRALRRAKHSHAPLYTTQQRILDDVTDPKPASVAEAKERMVAAIDEVVTEIESSKEQAAAKAATLIDDGDVVLTHDNSSTVKATLDHAADAGTAFELYVTESRPRYLGRKTARKLADSTGVDVTLIVDGAVGHHMADCDRVLVGMNCIIDDVVYNRVGTYPIATTAAAEDVPVTVVGSSVKFIGGGFAFKNTFRAPSEVLLEPADGFDISNPGYDATPTTFLDTIVTEDAIIEF